MRLAVGECAPSRLVQNIEPLCKEYGGLDLEQARRMKDLEKENARLRRLAADLSLEKEVLKDISSGNL